MDNQQLAASIDHTLLKPDCLSSQIARLCDEAARLGCAAVCVPPAYTKLARQLLQEKPVRVATVIGFPFGYQTRQAKVAEARTALNDGADELDMVINLSALLSGDRQTVRSELLDLVQLVHEQQRVLKWIIESGILPDNELDFCCSLAAEAGVHFVKTATGFIGPGATVEQVSRLRSRLPASISVKASGGIRSRAQALALLAAGATRLGSSATVSILSEESA